MTERSVTHATFVIERSFAAAPARVYRAFADPREKAKWFGGDENWTEEVREEWSAFKRLLNEILDVWVVDMGLCLVGDPTAAMSTASAPKRESTAKPTASAPKRARA